MHALPDHYFFRWGLGQCRLSNLCFGVDFNSVPESSQEKGYPWYSWRNTLGGFGNGLGHKYHSPVRDRIRRYCDRFFSCLRDPCGLRLLGMGRKGENSNGGQKARQA